MGILFNINKPRGYRHIPIYYDPEKEEGPDGYAVFAALTQTAETEWSSLLPTWCR